VFTTPKDQEGCKIFIQNPEDLKTTESFGHHISHGSDIKEMAKHIMT
jgi:hypothetical protein